jgi:hypothetical protein
MLVQGQERETGISCLKRAYGLGSCTWRGLDHFNAYVWSVADNTKTIRNKAAQSAS